MTPAQKNNIDSRNNHIATMAYLSDLTSALQSAASKDISQREDFSRDAANLLLRTAYKHANMCTINNEHVYAAETLQHLKRTMDRFPNFFSKMHFSDVEIMIGDNYRNRGLFPSGSLRTRK